jgi:hypothetical protein
MTEASVKRLRECASLMSWSKRRGNRVYKAELAMLFELSKEDVVKRVRSALLHLRKDLELEHGVRPTQGRRRKRSIAPRNLAAPRSASGQKRRGQPRPHIHSFPVCLQADVNSRHCCVSRSANNQANGCCAAAPLRIYALDLAPI